MASDMIFIHESVQDLESMTKYLDALRDGIAKGKVTLRDHQRDLPLEPQGMINFAVAAKKKGDKLKLTLKFSWKEGEEASGTPTFSIEAE